tara:strand:- start:491 stop:697 length:207 start_codon:yes stop_codon:yes gene_type:complete
MSKILVINQFGKGEIKDSDFLPRVGDKVDMFYEPLPTVTQVVMWPSKERLSALKHNSFLDVIAIITVA